jgi:multiple sugar transport system permease protein
MTSGRHRGISPNSYVLPAIFYVTVLTIFPFAYLIYMSFFNWHIYGWTGPVFNGGANFVEAVTSATFQKSIVLTLAYGGFLTLVELPLGIGVALLLNREGRLASFVKLAMMLPLVMTPFLIFMQWKYLLTAGTGPVSYVFQTVTGDPYFAFFSAVPNVYLTFLAVDIWQWLPFVTVVAIAGLNSMPREPLEAAQIDGANYWISLRHITLPLLRPTVVVIVLFRLIDSFKTFESVYLFTGGGPGTATNFASWLIFKTGLGIVQDIGLSSAYAVLFLILVLTISWTTMYAMLKIRRG